MIGRARTSLKWFLFAVRADDRRRGRYSRLVGRLRAGEVRRRRAGAAQLPAPAFEIPADVGFCVFAPDALDGVADVVADVQRIREGLSLRGDGAEKPYLLEHSIDEPSPALLRFALHEQVIAPIAHYLGMIPMLTGITLLASPHVPGEASGSQRFHSDWEDVRQVKVFVNCSPVAEENGPLTAVVAEASQRVKAATGYHYGGPSFRLSDSAVVPFVDPHEVVAFTGPPGTTVFIDTSTCLHLGSRVSPGADERLVVQFQFLTPLAFDVLLEPRKRRPFAALASPASAVERLVLCG